MAVQEKFNTFEAKNFMDAFLTGVCKCGKQFNLYIVLPETIEAVCGSLVFKAKPAEHIIINCPACGRLVNCGNGSRRSKRG